MKKEDWKNHTWEMNIYTYFSLKDQSIYSSIYLVGVSHKYWQCHSWVAVSQTLKFLPLALVRNDIVYSPSARRQCHSLLEQEEEISMSARLPPRNGPLIEHSVLNERWWWWKYCFLAIFWWLTSRKNFKIEKNNE